MIPILLGVMLLAMLLLNLMPGDPAVIMAGETATPEAIQKVRSELHLDQPVWERFGRYVWGVVHGDLGRSPGTGIRVWDRISPALPVTLSLGVLTIALVIVVGVSAGTLSALRRGRLVDRIVTVVSSVMQAVPPFVIGLVLVIVLAVDRKWFPANGFVPLTKDPWEWFHHLILPSFTLALLGVAQMARQTRSALIETLDQDFIRATRAKGVREFSVIGKHAAKNAATPVVTVLGLQVGAVLGGAVIVEALFAMPGFGSLALDAVTSRDAVLIQGVVLISAVAVLVANLAVDISYAYFNPRTRG